ncbi:RNA methyltransferase [Candidatus Collierbacteria bacterium]|nr:RNA methyltransferase [Candidatus Collierbacteria bacterium]
MEVITSRQNPRYKEIRKLIDEKKYRQETGCFFVDGVNFVAQAVENGWEIEQLVYVPNVIDTEFKKTVLAKIPAEKYFPIDEALYQVLSSKGDIQGVGAVIKQRVILNTLSSGTGVVLENIANPGNLGSIARLCAAFGIENLYTIAPAVEYFHPEAVRASMGAIFHLNLVEFDSLSTMKQRLLENNYFCIGTSLQEDAIDLSSWTTSEVVQNTLFWFGSEARGLSSEAKELCPTLLRIPMGKAVDSLNVAECAAIVIYELFFCHRDPPSVIPATEPESICNAPDRIRSSPS